MAQTTIYGVDIDHDSDVDRGLSYLKANWNDRYIVDTFENARTSQDRKASFRIDNKQKGMYLLKYLGIKHYSLDWVD